MTVVRRLPAVVVLVVLAILPIEAWSHVARPPILLRNRASGLDHITWAGTLRADGRLASATTYHFSDDQPRTIDVRIPDGGRLVTVDGHAVALDIGRYASVAVHGTATVQYELPAAVGRYPDGVLFDQSGLDEDGRDASDAAAIPCVLCYVKTIGYGNVAVEGVLHAPGAEGGQLYGTHLSTLRTETAPGELRFVGVVNSGRQLGLVAVLPAAAASDAPPPTMTTVTTTVGTAATIAPKPLAGTAAERVAQLRTGLRLAGAPLRAPSARPSAGRVTTAVVLTILLALLVVWIVRRLALASRRRALEPDAGPDVEPSSSPPNDLEPALVGVVVGASGRGDRSAVAGTLLHLAHRGVIRIDGLDSQRFTLTVPAGAQGRTRFEEAVLATLRPQGQVDATATLTGPPLWGAGAPALERRLRRVGLLAARRAGLIRVTLSVLVLLPATIAMGLVGVIGAGGLSALGWFAVFGGPVLALAAASLTGWSLTRTGKRQRDQWVGFGHWLRDNSALGEVGAPGVAVWGEALAYGAVLGAAPAAARALSAHSNAG